MSVFSVGDQSAKAYLAAYRRCEEAVKDTRSQILALAEIASASGADGQRRDLVLEWEERCERIADLWSHLSGEEPFTKMQV